MKQNSKEISYRSIVVYTASQCTLAWKKKKEVRSENWS